ncbi:MAG: EutN/CcmL family microcompartment protein [Burkholderiaceae bacterium]
MLICKTIGSVVSTMKHERLHSRKLLLVRTVSPNGKPMGDAFVAVDAIGAGEDELVLVSLGSAARETESTQGAPVDATIIGIVDSTAATGKFLYNKAKESQG